ncbi:GNAT family N-acetyltransferase [Owenweeksia hongkongensis]|uniref:GNAT family N-acetyltransferase n=1 Tax=Owenweeksia hongkongensis TaxID=253245 RepID=UPI003A929DB1
MILDPSNPEDRELFYKVARRVRENYDSSIFSLWSDSLNLEEIAQSKEKQLKIFGKEGGRVAVFKLSESLGAIGWYECSDDDVLSTELLSWACDELRAMGVKSIIGPINGSTWYNYRFNLSSSKPMFGGEPHQPHYYVNQWERFGFEISENYKTNVSELEKDLYPNLQELEDELATKGLILKKFTAEVNNRYVEAFYNLVTTSFRGNKAYSAISKDDYERFSANYPKVLDQDHSFVVFDNDIPIAFIGCIQDLFRPFYLKSTAEDPIYSEEKLIIKTLVVHPDWQSKGVGALLVKAAMRSAVDDGIYKVIHALMHEDNLSAIGGKRMFGTSSKSKYALFKLKIDGE